MIVLFYRIKQLAAYINIPYLLWVTFAGILNAAYFFLNGGILLKVTKVINGFQTERLYYFEDIFIGTILVI